MKKEIIRYKIDQLRKDKMIYALESIAFTLVIGLGTPFYGYQLKKILYAIAFLYFVYMVIGNTQRLMQIKKLQKMLP